MYEARLRVHGARIVSDDVDPMLGSPVLTVSSDPLSVEVLVPAGDVPSYLELIWIRPRPLTQHGNRLNLRTLEQEVWRWYWWSLRLRRRPGSLRHLRLTRTRGRWIPLTRGTLATIPEPKT